MMKIRRAMLLVAATVCAMSISAQSDYEKKQFVSGQDKLDYRVLPPLNHSADKRYPLVVFLHGMGERGSDNEKQLTHGSQMFLNPVNRAKYQAYVVFPQCPEDAFWAYEKKPESYEPETMPIIAEPTRYIKMVRGIIKEYIDNGLVDPARVYVVGISMGAMATYDLAIRYPSLIAAAVPVCGAVNPSRLSSAKSVKFRIFHGDADGVVPVEGSRAAYNALRKAGADVNYTEFVGCTHNSWNPAFNMPDFMKWLFSNTK